MPPVSQHSMLSHYQSETETLNICIFWQEIVCQQKYLTSVLFVDRHNWSLSCSMINATCSDVATKHSKKNFKKKCIHDVCLCYSYMFRCGTKRRENLRPSVNFGNIHQLIGPKTNLLWIWPPLGTQKHTTCNWVKKCKKWPASILDVPAPARPACGSSFRLL